MKRGILSEMEERITFFSTIRTNPSIEDGAIMIRTDCNPLILKGFSYRLYPPPFNVPREKNMGSGYNSALDFSGCGRVVCIYLITKASVRKFIKGYEVRSC